MLGFFFPPKKIVHENVFGCMKRRENEGLYFNDSLTMEKKKSVQRTLRHLKTSLSQSLLNNMLALLLSRVAHNHDNYNSSVMLP